MGYRKAESILFDALAKVAQTFAERCIQGIFGQNGREQEFVATCLLLRVSGHSFCVTAGHVMKNIRRDWTRVGISLQHNSMIEFFDIPIIVYSDDIDDVCIFELPASVTARTSESNFVYSNNVKTNYFLNESGDQLVTFGGIKKLQEKKNGGILSHFVRYSSSEVQDVSGIQWGSFDYSRHLPVKFSPELTQSESGRIPGIEDPDGMSGGVVLSTSSIDKSKIWNPEDHIKVVGILTDYHPELKLFRCTRMERLLHLIVGNYRETTDVFLDDKHVIG